MIVQVTANEYNIVTCLDTKLAAIDYCETVILKKRELKSLPILLKIDQNVSKDPAIHAWRNQTKYQYGEKFTMWINFLKYSLTTLRPNLVTIVVATIL